jgi:hypothetical protein
MSYKHLIPLVLLALATSLGGTKAQAAPNMRYLCETKTSYAEKWFFSGFFDAAPNDSARLAFEFTKFVRSRFGSSSEYAIGPADCYYRQSRAEVENIHDLQSRGASSNGNSVVETGWVPER